MKKYRFQECKKQLSNKSGLTLIDNLWNKFDLNQHFKYPKKFKNLVFSLVSGAECLDDIDQLKKDHLFKSLVKPYSSKTIGNFLGKYSNHDIYKLNQTSLELAFSLREKFFDDKKFILSMDSTPHEQTGKKMEGVAWNYKNQWCLDSQNAYDQFGINYGFRLRPGNTHSSVGSTELIYSIFSKAKEMDKWFRADSAYANKNNYNALLSQGVKFAMPLKSSITKRLITLNSSTCVWKKAKNLRFFSSDNCELAHGRYPIEGLHGDRKELNVVFVRVPVQEEQIDIFSDERYKYYTLVTNLEQTQKSDEEVFKFYMKRANCENFIRDQKYGFDFLHFPCLKLNKNRVYGAAGTIAYNFMRVLGYMIKKEGCFAKKVRSRLIDLPCIVIKHARSTVFRLNSHHKEVIEKFMNHLNQKFMLNKLKSSG